MNDSQMVIGFITKQLSNHKATYWWIMEDKAYVSMSEKDGARVLRFLQENYYGPRTPHFAEYIRHIHAMWRYHAANVLYQIAKKLGRPS